MTSLRFLPLALLLPTLPLEAQPVPPTLPTTSPAARVYQRLGVTDIAVAYHRQALILERLGDRDGAVAAGRRPRELAAAAAPEIRDEYLRLNDVLLARLGAAAAQ